MSKPFLFLRLNRPVMSAATTSTSVPVYPALKTGPRKTSNFDADVRIRSAARTKSQHNSIPVPRLPERMGPSMAAKFLKRAPGVCISLEGRACALCPLICIYAPIYQQHPTARRSVSDHLIPGQRRMLGTRPRSQGTVREAVRGRADAADPGPVSVCCGAAAAAEVNCRARPLRHIFIRSCG